MAEATFEITMSVKDQQLCYNYLMAHIGEIMSDVRESTVHVGYNKLLDICKSAVDLFYGEDDTDHGGRTGDLYNAYDVGIKDGEFLTLHLGPELMEGYHHQGAAFVYENSFVRGFHGGSMGKDKKTGIIADKQRFRVPAPFFTSWGPYAPKGTRIRDRIVKRFSIFDSNTFRPLQKKELKERLIAVRQKLGV